MSDLWSSWLNCFDSLDEGDALWYTLLEGADEMQTCIFNAAHGFYRVAAACLRSSLEWTLAAAYYSALSRKGKPNYSHFSSTCDQLHRRKYVLESQLTSAAGASIFGKRGWTRALYDALCRFAHPYQSSTAAMTWGGSNGPVYRSDSFRRVASLYVETVALCFVLMRLSKPSMRLPIDVTSLIANNTGREITQPGLKLASHIHLVLV